MSFDVERKSFFTPFVLAVLVIITFYLVLVLLKPAEIGVKVEFFDVGQGDSALISTPQRQYILIDGGPNNNILPQLEESIPFYHRQIDVLILTHPHADHLNGFLEVIKKYEVKKIYGTGVLHTTPEYLEFLDLIKTKQITFQVVVSGDSLDLGDDVGIKFLYPIKNLSGQRVDNLNNSSVIAKLNVGKSSILFMGDLEAEAQNEILKTGDDIATDILKVSHHGSSDSLNKTFLSKVSPRFAVISVGKDNKFNHPSSSVLNALSATKIYRTDQDGKVIFLLTKDAISIK